MTLTRKVERRQFLRGAMAAAGSVAVLPALEGLTLLARNGRVHASTGQGGYGPLIPTADLRDGAYRLALPDGFHYRSFSVSGDVMADGHLVPIAMDGMGAFNMADGKIRLVRNHEDRNAAGAGTIPVNAHAYDRKACPTAAMTPAAWIRSIPIRTATVS